MVAALGTGLAVPLLMVESLLTGSFAWEFNRANLVPTDVLVGIPVLIVSIGKRHDAVDADCGKRQRQETDHEEQLCEHDRRCESNRSGFAIGI